MERRESDAPRPSKALRDEWYALVKEQAAEEQAQGCGYCRGECEHEPVAGTWEQAARGNLSTARAVLVPFGLMQSDADMQAVERARGHWSRFDWRQAQPRGLVLKHTLADGRVYESGGRNGTSKATLSRLGLTRGVKAASLANLVRRPKQGDAFLPAQSSD